MNEELRCTDPGKGRLLAAYELGLLSPEEWILFEGHAAACPACLEDLYDLATEVSALRANPGRAAALLSAERAGAGRETAETAETGVEPAAIRRAGKAGLLDRLLGWFRPVRGGSLAWGRLVPAAAVAAILFALLLQQTGGADWGDLADLRAVPYVPMQTRGLASEAAERLFRDGMSHYAAGRYRDAARSLAAAAGRLEKEPNAKIADQVDFFAGLSFLLEGEPLRASDYLSRSAGSRLAVIADRSRWYLAQTCLLREDPGAALEHLEWLAANSPIYRQQATAQIAAIREMTGN